LKITHTTRLAASLAIGLGLASTGAVAQTTDGYHTIQIFPVVDCPAFNIPAGKTVTFLTLRQMCPGMSAPGQFGFLYTSEMSAANLPYAGFSRVANPQGNGFTVEAFPAHTFTSADRVVNGIRRRAASGGAPSFSTNCFIGNLNDITPNAPPVSTPVAYTVYNSATSFVASAVVSLAPGQFVRLLDVFAAAGAPLGDYDDAQLKVEETGTAEPGLMSFCTVQDNTSFGADFRIAKQEVGAGGLSNPGDVIGAQDNHVSRETRVSADGLGRPFEIGTGAASNTHLMYFRHPDYVQCEIIEPVSNIRAVPGYGLEMRLLDLDGQVIAGGDNQTGFGKIYLGDKTDRNGGSNTRYTIEVEDTGANTGSARPYRLHCQSGSGHTVGDLIRYKEATVRF
jgi:hypothetical protein